MITTSLETLDTLGVEGFSYADLYEPARLRDLADRFDAEVARADPELSAAFSRYAGGAPLTAVEQSDVIVRMAPHLGAFVARLFGVEPEAASLARDTRALATIFDFRKRYVRRRAMKRYSESSPPEVPEAEVERRVAAMLDPGARASGPHAGGTPAVPKA